MLSVFIEKIEAGVLAGIFAVVDGGKDLISGKGDGPDHLLPLLIKGLCLSGLDIIKIKPGADDDLIGILGAGICDLPAVGRQGVRAEIEIL